MNKLLAKYLNVFKKLRIDRSRGPAPHKPILLLSILQTFQNGMNFNEQIFISPELVALFKTNWNLLVTSNHDCRFALPFYHLSGDKFWKLIPKVGFENILKLPTSMRSFASLNAAVDFAVLDGGIHTLMLDRESNLILQQFLLNEYFSNSEYFFNDSYGIQRNLLDDIESKILNEPSEKYRTEIKKLIVENNEEEIFLRGSLFKREIPKIYNNSCCISEMRVDATISISMIDACHIVPFRVSFDDTVSNGISLCPNLHRAFDRGLIGIDENYRVVVSTNFNESKSDYGIRIFDGKEIKLPNQKSYLPLKNNFEWHLKHIFKSD